MNKRLVYVSNRWVPESKARLSLFDTAIATGELAVEVTRTFHHKPFRLREHIKRLYTGLKELYIDPGLNMNDMIRVTEKTLQKNLSTAPHWVDWQIIHYISRGPAAVFELFPQKDLRPTVVIQCIPLDRRLGKMAKKYVDGIDLVVTPQRLIPADVLSPQIKSRGRLDYILARLQAKAIYPGASGVLLDTNGYVVEGTGTSLFFVKYGKLYTAPSHKVLQGTTRHLIFILARKLSLPIIEKNLTVSEAAQADEIFETSTVICLVHARTFNGNPVGDTKSGPVTRTMRTAFIHTVGLDFVAQAQIYEQHLVKGYGNFGK